MSRETETITLDAIHSEVWNLYYLLDTIMDQMMEMDYVRDGKRDTALDRTAALACLARDQAKRIGSGIDENYHSIRQGGAK